MDTGSSDARPGIRPLVKNGAFVRAILRGRFDAMPRRKPIEPISPAEIALNGMRKLRAQLDLEIAALESTIPARNNGKPRTMRKVFDPTPILKKMGKL